MKKLFFTFTALLIILCQFAYSQNEPRSGSRYPVGERLTYSISFSNFPSAAFAEIYVVSQGKYGERDAIMLQGKLRTIDLVRAAFFTYDQTRQTLVAADTGLPFLSKRIHDENGMAREKTVDLKGNGNSHDWLSAIYQLRFSSAPTGSISIKEGDEVFQAVYTQVGRSNVKTAAGQFDTIIYDVQNPTFPRLRIYISADEQRWPVLITFKHPKGMFRAELAGIQDLAPAPVAELTTKPQTTPTPVTATTPKPRPTPTPYINNQPLSPDLPFTLGETLTYRLSRPGTPNSFGTMVVQAKERRQFSERIMAMDRNEKRDFLLLCLTVQDIVDANSFLVSGDSVKSYVDPESLLPRTTEVVFKGAFSQFNQVLNFNQALGKVNDSRGGIFDIPVGTHDLLSLAYAVRSFNLKEAKTNRSTAPAQDTRVALFTSDGPVILTILSQPEETLDFQDKKVVTQVILTNVGQTTVKLWLSKEGGRLPLRLSVSGPSFSFTADLVSVTQNPPPVEEAVMAVPGISQGAPINMPPSPNFFPVGTPNKAVPAAANTTVVNPRPPSDIKKP